MRTTTTVRKPRGSAITTLPPFISNFLKVEIGDELSWEIRTGEVILTSSKTRRKRTKLNDLLDKFGATQNTQSLEDEQWLNSAPQGRDLV